MKNLLFSIVLLFSLTILTITAVSLPVSSFVVDKGMYASGLNFDQVNKQYPIGMFGLTGFQILEFQGSCSDTDPYIPDPSGGLLDPPLVQYYVKGTVTTSTGTKTDYCDLANPNTLAEYYCSRDGDQRYTSRPCDFVGAGGTCVDGKCVYPNEGNVASDAHTCKDSVDNDGDGSIDCADSDCINNAWACNTCESGATNIGSCSSTKPKYCQTYNTLTDNCSQCGCPSGQICQGDGTCTNYSCDNGATIINSCSSTKPKYCQSHNTLINDCTNCGCPYGQACQINGTCSPACNPSIPNSCKNPADCVTYSGGKWCTGTGYSNSYCDVSGASCTTSSMCGNGVCDKGEGSPYGPVMCQQDCSPTPSPSPVCGSGSNLGYCNSQSSCTSAGGQWCANQPLIGAGIGYGCTSSCGSSPSPSPGSPACGDGNCTSSESKYSCSRDCGISEGYKIGCGSGTRCGDGICNINCNVQEDWYICHTDCPKTGVPVTTPIPCSTADPSGCQSESTCKATGANWCTTTSGSSCSKLPCNQVPTPTILPNQTLQPSPTTQLPSPTPRNLTPTKPVTVLESEVFEIKEILSTLEPLEINISEKIFNTSGIQKLHLDLSQNFSGNISIEIKTLDNIPTTDEKNQTLFLPEEQYIKVIHFIPSEQSANSIEQTTVEFSLTDQELASSNLKPEDVVLARFDNGWQELQTTYLGNQAGIHQFKAVTLSFSVFIVTKRKLVVTTTPTSSPTPTTPDKRETSLRKIDLVTALISIEQFKIKFGELASTSKSIAEYYLRVNKTEDYTEWLGMSSGFLKSMIKLDAIRVSIKSVRSETTEQDIKNIESQIGEVLQILDSSIDFLLSGVLNIGELPTEEETIALVPGQSIKFVDKNGKEHTMTFIGTTPEGEAILEFRSARVQTLELGPADPPQDVKVSETGDKPDATVKVNKLEKGVAYIVIKSSYLSGLIPTKGDVACLNVTKNLELDPIKPAEAKCFNLIADNIVLDGKGKRIDGGGLPYGIKVEGRSGITIKNFVLANYFVGVKLTGVRDSTITNMVIESVNGIEVQNSANNRIVNNKIHLTSVGDLSPYEVQEAEDIFLNEVILNEAGNGAYTPFVSIKNNLDPSKYKDANGNQLATIDLIIETTVGSDVVKLQEPVKFKKGETKLINTGMSTVPVISGDNGYVELKIKITALGETITKEFTKQLSLKDN